MYDSEKSYEWNYRNPPSPVKLEIPPSTSKRTYAGLPVDCDIAVAAGPILNGSWALYYASLGWDVLTYKTVRSHLHPCNPRPNILPIEDTLDDGKAYVTKDQSGSQIVSFGMPSPHPCDWMADIRETRDTLDPEKILVVSVAGSGNTIEEVAADFAKTARWAVNSGADAIEANVSCPNVNPKLGQLYKDTYQLRTVVREIRNAIGDTPLLLKIGPLTSDPAQTALMVRLIEPFDVHFVTTNCSPTEVVGSWSLKQGGIAGKVTFLDSVRQTKILSDVGARVIGVGGISSLWDVFAYLQAGAESMQVATTAMYYPEFIHDLKVTIRKSRLFTTA